MGKGTIQLISSIKLWLELFQLTTFFGKNKKDIVLNKSIFEFLELFLVI